MTTNELNWPTAEGLSGRTRIRVDAASVQYRQTIDRVGTVSERVRTAFNRQARHRLLTAVDGVSFTVDAGEVVAVIGLNGAGKTTLMKLVARVLPPSDGRVRVLGQVAPMIELTAGFNGDLTGRENVILFGALLGHDPRSLRAQVAELAQGAGISAALDTPVRTYSSGMLARLGFAVATYESPDILLIDEVWAVGDRAFQAASTQRIAELVEGGTAVVLVSHDLDLVSEVATRTLWMDKGRIVMDGDPSAVRREYETRTAP